MTSTCIFQNQPTILMRPPAFFSFSLAERASSPSIIRSRPTSMPPKAFSYSCRTCLVVKQPQGGKEAYVADNSVSLLEQVKLKAVEIAKSFLIDMWLARVTEAKIIPILHKVIEAAHEEYSDAIKHGEGIYAVGYCVGGRYVLLLAKGTQEGGNDEESGMMKAGPFIKAGALAHAASVTPDDFKNLQAPLSLVCVENDALFTDEVRKVGEDLMTQDNVEHEVQVYPGVPHGFAVAGQYQESNIMDAQVTAYEQMLRWLKDH
ncbi:uncharacterized protein TrAtP1_003177 [Trichoderma atroviride]|uniref:uncharacterized protein n=1 Tax=Hypocrea atroviridis TaxID=63577 RepID=UPI00332EA093|nr:hypothetical protein TrAtP1_003177 [Trichoderma atroviride]